MAAEAAASKEYEIFMAESRKEPEGRVKGSLWDDYYCCIP